MAGEPPSTPEKIELPAPTAWPIVLAFGLTLIFTGPVTSGSVSVLGAVIAVAGAAGWFRDVLPRESHEHVPIVRAIPAVLTRRSGVDRIELIPELTRAALPLETYPISSGVIGGLVGSVAMAVLAMLYGLVSKNGIWYPVNLLAAGFFPGTATETAAEIGAFNLYDLVVAIPVHLLVSLLVGLLYGTLLPMLPRRPILLGGIIAPAVWSVVIYYILGSVNPVLNQRINWFWFVFSQIGFGIAAGIVVSMRERVHTRQHLPLVIRAGIETPGLLDERKDDQTP
jgi:hypothetical protein